MATLKEVKSKISGVKKTKQITSAMKMVATSKLRGAQDHMERFRPYAEKFAEVLGSLAGKSGEEASPLFTPKEEIKKVHVVLCTSDRGLCGGFNVNLIDASLKFIEKNFDGSDVEVSYTNFGKKGRDWCRTNDYMIDSEHVGVVGSTFDFSIASSSGETLINSFLDDTYDEVYLVYAKFQSVARQIPIVQQLLPIPPGEIEDDGDLNKEDESAPYMAEHLCEPSPAGLLGEMLPKNVYIQLYRALLETSTSEQASRMSAMDNATKACNDMIDELQTIYNKTRQAGITADLMDIVGGAEALSS